MDRKDIMDKLVVILEEEYEISREKVNEKATIIVDLGLGSMEFMGFILSIEKEFGFTYNFETDLNTVEDLVDYIADKVNK